MGQLIANRYAKSLFDLALDQKKDAETYLDTLLSEMILIKEVFGQSEMQKFIFHPQISSIQKMEFLETALKGKVLDAILGLFSILLNKNREAELIDVCEAFIKLCREHKGITKAVVKSAVPLSSTQLDKIRASLQVKLKKQVEIETMIDKDLIGGLCIQVDGLVLDATIQKQLQELKKRLQEVQLA